MVVRRFLAVVAGLAFVVTGCGSSGGSGNVKAAQSRVSSKQKAVTDAQAALEHAHTQFCTDSETYIRALDQYGKIFDDSAATVGDAKTAGADLEHPSAAATASAQDVVSARDALSTAKQELVDAQVALANAQASSSGASTSSQPPTTSTTTTTIVPAATVNRVQQAEADFTAATKRVTDETPLVRAGAEVNAAAFALEAAWLRLFADAGCLTNEQQTKAEAALATYTTDVQTALQTTGFYTGKIDGVYGPATVDAVKKLQTSKGLPATGFVDRATETALTNAMLSKGGAAATQALANAAAVQATLKLAGYWTGPVDGHWTPELTDAFKKFQTALGVPASGAVDTATLSALEATIAKAKTAPTTPPSSAASTTHP